jgi:hypothetical protein
LWAAYRAALRTTFALLADLYDAVDARDVALRRAQSLQEAHDRLTADLGLSRRQGERLQVLLRHSRTELEQAEQLAHSRDDEARRARADVERLTIQVRDLEAERDRMALDAQRLNSELQQLAEQGMARSTDGRVGELQAVQNALRAEYGELEQLLATLTEALDAARGQAAAGPEADGTTLPALEEDRVTEVERRHTLAMHAIEHLSEQLRRVSREFAHARAELVRRDGELARLVEQHAAEIAALRASSVLAEADNILSVALQSLGPTPALLPPDDNVPTPETTPSPSSGTASTWISALVVNRPRPSGSRSSPPHVPARANHSSPPRSATRGNAPWKCPASSGCPTDRRGCSPVRIL